MTLESQTVEGIAVSPGIAIGRAMRVTGSNRLQQPEAHHITPAEVEGELTRFSAALDLTRSQLHELQQQVRSRLDVQDAEIFEAHLLIVDDHTLISEVEKQIREGLFVAEYALYSATEKIAGIFSGMSDEYLRERAADIRDVSSRIMSNLSSVHSHGHDIDLDDRRIIVASNLTPSETARFDAGKVLGFAVETGSVTSHSAILARSMRIPALVGIPGDLPEKLSADDILIVDGFTGKLIINPDSRTLEAYRLKAEQAGQLRSQLESEKELQPETTDGFIVQLAANLESADRVGELRNTGAYGVGLFRTEFLFMDSSVVPDEEEQFEIYKKLLVEAGDLPVVIRTLDVGGDKFSSNIYRASEQNPFLGLRGIRLCLHERRDIFDTQLRALLRAGVFGRLRVMLPMISSVREVIEVKAIIASLQQELDKEKKEYVSNLSLGVMIETPAAALMAEHLASLIDFFSIGTNDLVQYTMAIDRGNERVAYLNRPSHPAILELIRRCVEAARKHNIYVTVCGQAAADPYMAPLLAGLGVHELSMAPASIAVVRRVIRSMSMHEMERAAMEALQCAHASDSLAIAEKLLKLRAPEIANM